MVNVLDLFSGIGGFSLGLERAGMQTVAFCEFDEFCRQILAKHWPNIPIYDDVRSLTAEKLRANGIAVDVICGGFPCQDISSAGNGGGITGARSGLWSEFARIIGEVRPRYIIVENVAALLGRGIERVLGDLAALGFDAEWHCIPASAIGAPHRRDRVWIVAYANGGRCQAIRFAQYAAKQSAHRDQFDGCGATGWWDRPREWWSVEPDVGRMADGVPARMDRLRSLGNAVIPQIVEIIGRAIMKAERES